MSDPYEGIKAELATLRELRVVIGHFASEWTDLITSLPDIYECHMNCTEANAAADLYRAIGDDDTAASILDHHGDYDEYGDQHYHGPVPYQAQP